MQRELQCGQCTRSIVSAQDRRLRQYQRSCNWRRPCCHRSPDQHATQVRGEGLVGANRGEIWSALTAYDDAEKPNPNHGHSLPADRHALRKT